ncbi:phage tail sheath subtilisin-like domain-containing protein [Kitasatospora sp. NBC_01560]|uniref:phage tail sheath family protein n=1 Tax=Kitasatospora sp. NBC_01560 TaxID=2975965 RepID=UPI00386770BA
MPVNITYPGVYIEEIASPVRAITGVPTSVAAFVGYAPRGPVDGPVHITSWADYETTFGGLHQDSPMSYAVYQFYVNGGAEAEIVRIIGLSEAPLFAIGSGPSKPDDHDTRPVLKPISPGVWGQHLRARVDHDVAPEDVGKLYNLTVWDSETGLREKYLNVSADPADSRCLRNALQTSRLVVLSADGSGAMPGANAPAPDPDPFTPAATPPTPAPATPQNGAEHDGDDGAGHLGGPAQPPPVTSPEFTATKDVLPDSADYLGVAAEKTGIYALLKTDIFNLLCLPDALRDQPLVDGKPASDAELLTAALVLCVDRRAILLVDPPAAWDKKTIPEVAAAAATLPLTGPSARNAALYYPRVQAPDRLRGGSTRSFPPCGVMAGVHARTDVSRGVWKAAAGTDASLNGVTGLDVPMTDLDNGRLNPLGVNCLRQFPAVGPVAWGARTMRGADQLTDEWKYLPVRRLALFVEESLFRGTQWVVFEPNDEPLWASIRLNVGAFMNSLFREGAFQGRTPSEAYLVKCDRENNPQNDIDRGVVNVLVGFAPLKPAEFVIIHIQQLAGQIQV